MFQAELDTSVGNLGVETTQYRGHTPEEWAYMAANKIVSISNTAP